MSKYHAVSSGMVTRQALPSITRQRGTTTGSANLMLYGAGKTYAIGTNTTFTDSSANAFTVTRNGDTIQATDNPFTGSVVFDGTGDYLSIADNAAFDFAAGDFTVEGWIYLTTLSVTRWIIGQTNASFTAANTSFVFGISSSNKLIGAVAVGSTFTNCTSTANVSTNAWVHVAFVRSGASLATYINGTQDGTASISTSTINNSTNQIAVGRAGEYNAEYLTGYISNLRVVKGTAVYTANFTPPTSPLTAITNTSLLLLAGQQAPFRDSSSNAFTVTANGNAAGSGVEPPSFVPYAGSGYFDGTGDSLSLAANTAFDLGTGDFTIEFWAYWSVVSSTLPGNVCHAVNNGTIVVYITNSQIQLARYNIGGDLAATVTQVTGQWDHYAITRQSSTARIFKNGTLLNSGTVTTNYGQNGFQIGTGTSSSVTGYISNLRLVKGTAVYTANFTPSAAPLTAITNTSLLLLTNNVGPFIDSSANGFPVLRNGDTVQSGFNPFSQASSGAGYFDGTGDYLTVPYNTAFDFGSGNFTIESFVYLTATPINYKSIIGRWGGAGNTASWQMFFFSNTTRPGFQLNYTGTPGVVSSPTALALNTWHHIALVRNGTTVTLYANGTSVATSTGVGTLVTPVGSVAIGTNLDDITNQSFPGYISNARVVKGTAVYTSNFTPPTSPLTAISGTSLLLLTDNYSIVNSTATNIPVTLGNASISTAQFPTGMSSSMSFNGTTSTASVTGLNLSSVNWTIEGFVYFNSFTTTTDPVIFNFGADFNNRYVLFRSSASGKFNFTTANGGTYVGSNGTTTPSTGTWYHFALVKSGSVVTMYINGTSEATNSTAISSGTVWYFGGFGFSGFSNNYLNGYLSNVRICSGTALYTSNFTPPSAPLSTTVTVPAFVTNNIYGMNQIP